MTFVRTLCVVVACVAPFALVTPGASPLHAQPAVRTIPKAPLATPIPAESLPAYVRMSAPTDPVIARIWDEGMRRSQAAKLSQALLDSIGPRLTASPNMNRAQDWAVAMYKGWGISARKERYGTWNSWQRGAATVALTAPRFKSLEATMLSWSGNTGGRPVVGDVAVIKPFRSIAEYDAWLLTTRGKIVLASAPQLTCRMKTQVAEFATPATMASLDSAQRELDATYGGLTQLVRTFYTDLRNAGAVAVFESNWSLYPGINKVFGSPRNSALPVIDIGCEDYGMLHRLASNGQSPVARVTAESEFLGDQPVFNVIGEIKGATKPNEYVVLSAHFDSWEGHSGATDNGTGTITMMEAMRILRTVLPRPSRTILVGHWSGEEQGLNGSGSFAADHPEVATGLQFAFNQDNGTGRVVTIGPTIFPENGPRLAQYMSAMPREITEWIRMQAPAMYSTGSDHVSWLCRGAPAANLNALSWDYGQTTWHTNRDSYDKVMQDDLRNNATLTAMFAYMASEDPQRTSRKVLSPILNVTTGQPMQLPACSAPLRDASSYAR
ncbi:MAG TPA: M28 family peptidase [Gemmatimonas sp.]|nr:M28 family peptidase [Gemmatimonas sp.]